MVWGAILEARTLFLLSTSASASLGRRGNNFKEGKFKFLALTETKLRGKEEVSWSGVNVIITGAQEMERAREGVAILLNSLD